MSQMSNGSTGTRKLRSQLWFDNPENPGMTALYIERYLNFGLTPGELRSGKPIIGIAQTGNDLSPATATTSNSPSACATASWPWAACRWNFRSTRSRRPASGRPRRSTATSPISASSRRSTATRSTAWC